MAFEANEVAEVLVGGCLGQLMSFFEEWLWKTKVTYLSIPEPSSNKI
jgi:hypothetical protein